MSSSNKTNVSGTPSTPTTIHNHSAAQQLTSKPSTKRPSNKSTMSFRPTNNSRTNSISLKLPGINSMPVWPMSGNKKFIKCMRLCWIKKIYSGKSMTPSKMTRNAALRKFRPLRRRSMCWRGRKCTLRSRRKLWRQSQYKASSQGRRAKRRNICKYVWGKRSSNSTVHCKTTSSTTLHFQTRARRASSECQSWSRNCCRRTRTGVTGCRQSRLS